jgi:hypothetical protein
MGAFIEKVEIILSQQRDVERHESTLLGFPLGIWQIPAAVVYSHSSPIAYLPCPVCLAREVPGKKKDAPKHLRPSP